MRKDHAHVLIVDAGDLFGIRTEEMREQTRFLCKYTHDLGYKVIGLGDWDLNYGMEFLREMERTNGFHFISANVRREGEDKLLFPPYDVVEVGGLRVGLISVLSSDYRLVTMSMEPDDYVVDSPREALDRYLPELREKSDLIVLLAHMPSDRVRQLLLDLGGDSGVDIALEGHDARVYRRVNKVGNVYLLSANNQGKYVGQLDMVLSRSGGIQDAQLSIHALDDKSPEVKTLAEAVDAFKKENAQKHKVTQGITHQPTLGNDRQKFLGVHTCSKCHVQDYEVYRTSAHASAWRTLVEKGQANNAECVSCHVVGYDFKNGYEKVPGRNALVNVQCEACHGYGTEHDRTGAWLAKARSSCSTCHTEEVDPDFDYATHWAKVAH